MTIKKYSFPGTTRFHIKKWLEERPEYSSQLPDSRPYYLNFNLDFATLADEIQFRQTLLILGYTNIKIDDNDVLLTKFMDSIMTDQLAYSITKITMPIMSTSFVNLFDDYNGRPFLMDTTGFKQCAFSLFWDKGANPGTQRIRIINHDNESEELINVIIPNTAPNINEILDYNIPANFLNFKGRLRIQVNSTNPANTPTFSGLFFYWRRGD